MLCVGDVLEQLIRKLGLSEFPCGPGPWRQSCGHCPGFVDTQDLVDLLDYPASPWHQEIDWSPEASSLRRRASLSPKQLSNTTIYEHFTTLRLIDKGISVIDAGLLKFVKLEELVLSVNRVSEVPAELLPAELKVLELRNNHITSLSALVSQPPPRLHYLGLACNPLSSCEDICRLTGGHWPALVCLDLSFCDFESQSVLVGALSSMPSLRSLLLEGTPCSLARSYPGLTLDVLPRLVCLDKQLIDPEEREGFKGMARVSGARREHAQATVHMGRLQGLPGHKQSLHRSNQDFPLLSFSYHVSYDFIGHSQDPQSIRSESELEAGPNAEAAAPSACEDSSQPRVLSHRTCSLPWAPCIDFDESHSHCISDLRALKSFLTQGMWVRVHEEKILSWPAPKTGPKGTKEKDSPNKSALSKDKKRQAVPELVQDPPVSRMLGSVHVPLHTLLQRGHRAVLCCDFGQERSETPASEASTPDKDEGQKVKKDKMESKRATSEKTDRAKGMADPMKEASASTSKESPTVELSVQLERWRSTAEARQKLDAELRTGPMNTSTSLN